MPLGSTVPAWYNDNYYINEKVDECNTIKFGAVEGEEFTPWTADKVRDFMAGAYGEASYAPWMGYDNFVSNGNAENCSPSPYFVVAEYLAAKAAQLNEIKYEDKTDWTQADVLKAFKDANISAWDHYTTNGQAEGINPSNAFDNDAFFAAKCEILNSWQNEDGTVGYEGKDNWTRDDVVAVFQSLGINPIINQPENPDAASLIIKVDDPVNGGNFNPWGPATPVQTPVELTTGQDVLTSEGPTDFIATVGTSQAKSTLNADDQITGTDADTLTVDMTGSFLGMNNKGFVDGVGTVDLNNETQRDLNFNAKGITGVDTFNIDGAVSLSQLGATGNTVNYSNVHTRSNITIGYAQNVNSGPDDTLTIGLNDVYIPSNSNNTTGNDQPATGVKIVAQAIEDITVNSTGAHENYINVNGINYMRSLAVEGDTDLNIAGKNQFLTKIDGSKANGDLTFNLQSTGKALSNIQLGSGDDTLTTNNISATANISGSDGADNLIISGANKNYMLTSDGLETLTLKDTATNRIGLIGTNMDGLETLKLDKVGTDTNTGSVTLNDFPNSNLAVQGVEANNVNLTVADIPDVNIRVGDGDKNSLDSLTGTINLGDATNLTIDADDGINQTATFNAVVNASQVTYLDLNAQIGSSLTVTGSSDLSSVSSVEVSGGGNVVLGGTNSSIGTGSASVYVNTQEMGDGSFTGVFTGNTTNGGASLVVQGSNLADHDITIGSGYNSANINTGMGDDIIFVDTTTLSATNQLTLSGNLGGGENILAYIGDNSQYVEKGDLEGLTSTGIGVAENGVGTVDEGETATVVMLGSGTVNMGGEATANIIASEEGGRITVDPGTTVGNTANFEGLKNNVEDILQFDNPNPDGTTQPAGFLGAIANGFEIGTDKLALEAMGNGFGPYGASGTLGGTDAFTDWSNLTQDTYLPNKAALDAIKDATGIEITNGATFISGNHDHLDVIDGSYVSQNAIVWDGNETWADGGTFVMAGTGTGVTIVFLAGVQYNCIGDLMADCVTPVA